MSPQPVTAPTRPLGGVATGLALVLLAVLVGFAAERITAGPAGTATSPVTPTGRTSTVKVIAEGMRFHPDRITVAPGDRLVIELTNRDRHHHDLVLANGLRTPTVAPGDTVRLDAGVIGGETEGWCSLPGHRQAGMTLRIGTADALRDAAPRGVRGLPEVRRA